MSKHSLKLAKLQVQVVRKCPQKLKSVECRYTIIFKIEFAISPCESSGIFTSLKLPML
jgi:hypothetical protein